MRCHSTGKEPVARSCETSTQGEPCFRNPTRWTKHSIVRSKKNSTQMEFQAVSQLHCFRANAYFNTKVWYPGSNIGCFPTVSTNFLYRLMLNGYLLLRKRDWTDVWKYFWIYLWVWRPSLWSYLQGKLLLKNDFQQAFSSSVWLWAHRKLGKLYSIQEGKASTESVLSALYVSQTV